MPHHPGIRVINDPKGLRLIADPLRLRLLELLRERPQTVKDLAAALDLPRTRLYYHVGLLEQHGLIDVAETRMVSGLTEKVYRVTAYRLTIDRSLLGGGEDVATPIDTFVSLVLDEAAAEIRRAIAAGLIDLDISGGGFPGPRQLVIGRKWFRFTDEKVREFEQRLVALERDFADCLVFMPGAADPAPAEGELYEQLIGFYPILPPEDHHDDE